MFERFSFSALPSSLGTFLSGADSRGGEYQRLQDWLVVTTLMATAVIGVTVALCYDLNTAANYFLGAIVGVVYLRMLGRAVARLGKTTRRLGGGRLGVFLALMVVTVQIKTLHVIPVFLGFLTYKVALILYTFQVLTRSWHTSPRV
jgi:ATP synthase protein I